MNNRMDEILSGGIQPSRPELISSLSELRLRIQEGKKYKGSITLEAADGSRIKGLVTTDCHRILLAGNSIAGTSCKVLFGVDSTGLKAGDRISGAIVVSCSLAEKRIPLEAEIVSETVIGSQGEIRNLEEFAALCRKSFREGFRLFTGSSFPELLAGRDREYLPLYAGLSHNPVTYQHLEEFLTAAGLKEPVAISTDRQEKAVYHLETSQKDTLYIFKNNWGYVRIEAEVTGDFLQLEKKVITSEDFIGRAYGLEFIIDRERLHPGRNYGKLRLKTLHQEIELSIEASAGKPAVVEGLPEAKFRAAIARDMLDLQMHRLDYRTWHERGLRDISELLEEEPESSLAVLYDIYLSYSRDDLVRMRQLLALFENGSRTLGSEEEEVWYLYFSKLAGIRKNGARELLSLLRLKLEQSPDQYLYLHLLLQEDPSYEHMSARIMYELEQCYERGCNSPFLYLKAWKMLNDQEALLRRITPFYLQVLRFAAVRDLLSESLYRRAAFLSGSIRSFSEPLYRLLSAGYRKYQCVDILEAICKLIMKGQAYRKEYFQWYALAVEKELRITRLYEYYMETIPEEMADQIPRQIRLYFSYNNTLGEKKRAILYNNVLLHRGDDRTCYLNYQGAIRRFTVQALEKGKISEEYARLYQAMLERPGTLELAEKLVKVLFRWKVEVDHPSVRQVIVCHRAMKQERSYPCRDGVAYVDLYSEDACILFEDEKKRRFRAGISYSCKPLMEVKDIACSCMEMGVSDTGLELYLCREQSRNMEINGRTLEWYQKAEENQEFSEEYRRTVRRKLLEYYRENLADERLLISVLTGDMRRFGEADRVNTAVLLIESGLYEKAFSIVSEFGCEGIPDGLLLRLTSRMIQREDFREEEELLALAEYVFRRGKYDENILLYLVDNSLGSVAYLTELWESARGFGLERVKLEKRILMLSVLTGTMPADEGVVLESYVLNQGQEPVITAFLTWTALCWIYRDLEIPERIVDCLEKLVSRNWELNLICRLALLKQYSFQETLTPQQEKEAEKILALCREKKLAFAFFKDLPLHLIRQYQLENRQFVEERFPQGTRVTIHYCIGKGDETRLPWKSEPLREMIPGIFSKEFLLFYGEVLTSYLTWSVEGEELESQRRQMTLTSMDTEGHSRYRLLNRILAEKAMGNQEKMLTAVDEYLWKDAFTEHFCKIM
ncbi:MAG: DUF5717 family protein [Lachnospiraceae bacterium]|nr:DUF5717 family protein [Lachnospiraceae bacterium]